MTEGVEFGWMAESQLSALLTRKALVGTLTMAESKPSVKRAMNTMAGASFGGGPFGAVTRRTIASRQMDAGTVRAQINTANALLRLANR